MDGSDPLTPVERLFMEAGYSRTSYQIWRMSTLSSLKAVSRLERLGSGWPSEAFDDDAEELKLAKRWLERESRRAAADKDKGTAEQKAVASAGQTGPRYGPLMTTSEVQALIQEEFEAGSPVSLKAFEQALRRASRTARKSPEELPLQLGGQHKDWQLVELGPESGGHGKGHRLRRRLPHTTGGGNDGL